MCHSCVTLGVKDEVDGTWNDAGCFRANAFVCEIVIDSIEGCDDVSTSTATTTGTTTAPPPPPVMCDPGQGLLGTFITSGEFEVTCDDTYGVYDVSGG